MVVHLCLPATARWCVGTSAWACGMLHDVKVIFLLRILKKAKTATREKRASRFAQAILSLSSPALC
jgi:hypothetical protein